VKILLVGDIVGEPGRRFFCETVKRLRAENAVQVVIANAENAAAGNGITLPLAHALFEAGADVLTMGDHTWGHRDLESTISGEKRLLRPVNYPAAAPGHASITIQTAFGPLSVINAVGRVFMNPIECPFLAVDAELRRLPANAPVILDFHAEATSEKIAMGHYLDGRVAAVVGTHTHVQTSDAFILPKGTAFISDLGMTGCYHSVIGREITPVLKRFTTGIPAKFEIAKGPCGLEGVILDLNHTTGKAVSIKPFRVREPMEKC